MVFFSLDASRRFEIKILKKLYFINVKRISPVLREFLFNFIRTHARKGHAVPITKDMA